jgi:NADPH:quinone reductase-like Zn-dependent oxidoreductase
VAAIAAGMNPAMSSWIALRHRVAFEPGARVLVLGATGNAGRLAVEVAEHLGASEVIAAGRGFEVDEAAAGVDVVIDYVWGEPAARTLADVITRRGDRGRPLDWIQIGSVAGPTAPIPSAALRAANLRIVGSGQGSVSTADIVSELPALAAELSAGTFRVDPAPVALSDVERTWTANDSCTTASTSSRSFESGMPPV